MKRFVFAAVLLGFLASSLFVFSQTAGNFSGVVVTPQFEFVPGVFIEIETSGGILTAKTDSEGKFSIPVPLGENLSVKFSGRNIEPQTRIFSFEENLTNVQIKIKYIAPPVAETVTIESDTLTPQIESRSSTVFNETLFGRDDQIIFTLNAGINAGQHEGGGKSLEIRRYGFNTDHGGVGGGLKILVDNVQQNQGTQGHGQGYLGSLKSLSPELVEEVSIINGPFSAAYGDFSGLGVVKINLREALPNIFTGRIQAGLFETRRGFFAYSPQLEKIDAFASFEPSYTNGPFENPLKYRRDNFAGNLTYKSGERQALGFKFNAGRSDFFSSGQIPFDLIAEGELGRFGFIDPDNGGRVKNGLVKGYYRREFKSGTTFKADAFAARSLFDLFSNFTFFLLDPVYGDEIQQHDSRLQEGANVQVFEPYKFFGNYAVLTFGGSLLLNQINVGLYPSADRVPNRKFLPGNADNPAVLYTKADARVNNYAGYVQNDVSFFNGHVRLEAGLRWDYFSFDVRGFELSDTEFILDGRESDYEFQPKFGVAFSPFESIPASFYANYGRGISSQDARGIVRRPDARKIAVTDFFQFGTSYNSERFSGVLTGFLIDRSSEQIYIPDDGSIEFAEPSRSSGIEFRASARITKNLSLSGGLTQVLASYFRDTNPRIYVDSAPHTVFNAALVLNELRDFNVFLNYRHISNYRLDGTDESIRASGHDIVDLALSRRLKKWLDLNFSIDNLFNKKYFETQNYFESRAAPGAPVIERIHVTPGYSTAVNIGLTFRLGAKD